MKQKPLNSASNIIFIGSCALILLLLSILPLQTWLNSLRPAWLVMFVMYYSMSFPRFSILGFAWCLGLLLDVLYGSILGMHAFSLLVIAYLSHIFYKQIRVLPLRQQAIWVLLVVVLYQLLRIFFKACIGEPVTLYMLILPAISSMLIWPLFARVLLRLEARIA